MFIKITRIVYKIDAAVKSGEMEIKSRTRIAVACTETIVRTLPIFSKKSATNIKVLST